MNPANILVTGGCGFIGTNLIKNLTSQKGNLIRIVDNFSVGTREDLTRVCGFTELNPYDLGYPDHVSNSLPLSRVELVVADILDANLALSVAKGMDVIIHLAASTGVRPSVENPRQDMEANVIGALNYLEAARINGVRKFIFASSSASIGECEPPIHEEIAPHPVSPYGASKLTGEGYCSAYYRTFGIDTVALRFGNVYGPGSSHKNSVVAKFIKQAIGGETLEIYGNGEQTRDFIYVEDLVRAIFLAATNDEIGGEIFQIATNTETTVNELIDKLLHILADAGIRDVKIRNTSTRPGDVQRNFSDTSKAKIMLGWQSQIILTEGLGLTVEWFLNQYN